MSEFSLANIELAPVTQFELTSDVNARDIDKLPQLSLEPGRWRFIPQGGLSEIGPGDDIDYLMSDGFGKCSAVLIKDDASDTFTFAHAQPFDDELYSKLSRQQRGRSEALIIGGTHSVSQYGITQLLAGQGARISVLDINTGDTPFGVAVNTKTGLVSVLRSQPEKSLLQYSVFNPPLNR